MLSHWQQKCKRHTSEKCLNIFLNMQNDNDETNGITAICRQHRFRAHGVSEGNGHGGFPYRCAVWINVLQNELINSILNDDNKMLLVILNVPRRSRRPPRRRRRRLIFTRLFCIRFKRFCGRLTVCRYSAAFSFTEWSLFVLFAVRNIYWNVCFFAGDDEHKRNSEIRLYLFRSKKMWLLRLRTCG